jgi:uncharacterized membrane protein YdjX (TVP38/TMEM64 family)
MTKKSTLTFSIIYSLYTGIMPLIMSGIVSVWAYAQIDSLKNIGLFQAMLIFIVFTFAMGLSIIPTTFVALICGYIWGLQAIFPLVISYVLATIIGAKVSKLIDNNQILIQLNKNPKAIKILERLKNEQFKIIALARLSPVFPFGISNVIFTYMGVPLRQLLVAGIIGMLPRTIFTVWVASKADNIQKLFATNWQNYLQSPLFFVGLLSVFLLIYFVLKAFKK